MFEPLDALYTAMYGTKPGYNVPSDISTYWNGTERSLIVQLCLVELARVQQMQQLLHKTEKKNTIKSNQIKSNLFATRINIM